MTPEELKALKKEARSERTSPARLLELAQMDVQLSRTVAKSKYAPTNVLEQLARSNDVFTRRAVATRGKITTQILEQLACDNRWMILKEVAQHPKTPAHTLKHLTRHSRHTVRAACFGHPALVFADYLRLALDEHPYVRAAWLQHELNNVRSGRSPAVHAEEWQEWLLCPDVEIRRVVASHLRLVAAHSALQALIADELLNDEDVQTRESAALFASAQALERKWNDESFWVRACVASKTLDVQKLNLFVHDSNETVRRVVEHRLQDLILKGVAP